MSWWAVLELQPITFAEAREFVRAHHRHHAPPVGHILLKAQVTCPRCQTRAVPRMAKVGGLLRRVCRGCGSVLRET